MKREVRYVAVGTALGALLGALGGWLYSRPRGGGSAGHSDDVGRVDKSRIMRLVWSVIGVLRQIVELG